MSNFFTKKTSLHGVESTEEMLLEKSKDFRPCDVTVEASRNFESYQESSSLIQIKTDDDETLRTTDKIGTQQCQTTMLH